MILEADLLQVRSAQVLDKAGRRSILSASKAPRLGSASAGSRGRNFPVISARSHLGTEGDTSHSRQGKIPRRNPGQGRSGSSLTPALGRQEKPSSPSRLPAHGSAFPALFLWDGACVEGGSRGLYLPGQVCEGAMSASPASRAPPPPSQPG